MTHIVFNQMEEFAKENNVPIIQKDALDFILQFLKDKKVGVILEIGTAIGYSGAKLALATGAKLATVEINKELAKIAKENLKKLGVVCFVKNLDAKYFINQLVKNKNIFDLIFLDGPKAQYINYLPKLLQLLNKGGILIADNINFRNAVLGNQEIDKRYKTIVKRLQEFVKVIQTDNRLDTKIYKDIGDGVSVSIMK
ncbi:MAG: O-methyltransferase [Firmicutes bacterium]|nr:O-methyltransferase [Bacillota bacterium]